MTTHGHSRRGAITKTYRAWRCMIQRCERPHNPSYPLYGGRGITICESWHKFDNFLADMGEAPPEKSLDRINNNAGYSKENCRWATPRQQSANTRRNKFFEFRGERLHLPDWSRRLGVNLQTLTSRVNRNGYEKTLAYYLDRL